MPKQFRQDPTLPQGFSDTFRERFWRTVTKTESCWISSADLNSKGYPRLCRGRRGSGLVLLNRASWLMHYGEIPKGIEVCHHCDNPLCVNPAHLFLGPHAANIADMDAKGRRINTPHYGESNGLAKLTWEDVQEIRMRYIPFRVTLSQLAREYGVHLSIIHDVVHFNTWNRAPF